MSWSTFPLMRRLLRDRETCLIQDGRMLRRNMRREMVTEEELMSVLRKEGIEDMAEVHSAFMEADGEISVVTKVEVENDSNDAGHGVASSTFLARSQTVPSGAEVVQASTSSMAASKSRISLSVLAAREGSTGLSPSGSARRFLTKSLIRVRA